MWLIALSLMLPTTPAHWEPLLLAIEEQESRGNPFAKNGRHYGAFQVSSNNIRYPPQLLYIRPLCRIEASNILRRFLRWGAVKGDMYEGLKKYSGDGTGRYALCIAVRMLQHREGKVLQGSCKEPTTVYPERRLRNVLRGYNR